MARHRRSSRSARPSGGLSKTACVPDWRHDGRAGPREPPGAPPLVSAVPRSWSYPTCSSPPGTPSSTRTRAWPLLVPRNPLLVPRNPSVLVRPALGNHSVAKEDLRRLSGGSVLAGSGKGAGQTSFANGPPRAVRVTRSICSRNSCGEGHWAVSWRLLTICARLMPALPSLGQVSGPWITVDRRSA